MNFDFTAEQYELRDTISGFLGENWTSSRLRGTVPQPGLPLDIWDGLAELGLFTVVVPEAHGGLELDLTDTALLFETFGENLAPELLASTILGSDVLAHFGNDVQKSEMLPAVAEGRIKLGIALQDSATSFKPSEGNTTVKEENGGWVLNGSKHMVPCGQAASHLLVSARLPNGQLGIFLVDALSAGIEITPHVLVDPTYLCSQITFSDMQLPEGSMLRGEDGVAYQRLSHALFAATAAQLVGISGRAMAMTLDYAKQRTQFGRAVGSFQAIKHKLADMMVAFETARSAVYYAHWAVAQNHPDQSAAVSMAKAYAGDVARHVVNESVHIHGGIGFTWEHDIHFLLKRAKVLEYSAGDATWHREQYASALFGE